MMCADGSRVPRGLIPCNFVVVGGVSLKFIVCCLGSLTNTDFPGLYSPGDGTSVDPLSLCVSDFGTTARSNDQFDGGG